MRERGKRRGRDNDKIKKTNKQVKFLHLVFQIHVVCCLQYAEDDDGGVFNDITHPYESSDV